MHLYNSLTGKIEEFKSIHPNLVNMYVCGPTVYNHAHIGNARPIVIFDTLRRVFMQLGYQVKYVSNYTDVDDKIINQAKSEGVDENTISKTYIAAYEDIRHKLHALPLSKTVKVTESMDQIIEFIDELVKHDKAYQVDGDVYFKIDEVKNYGQLSKQKVEDLVVGARVEENKGKISPLDFTLWKQTQEGIKWDSPFGAGRPGWHTECVVMIQDEFDHQMIDIHGGGMDLKFPHHENEIAQSLALHHHPIANYWIHNGMLNIDGEKMSKSLGNVVWAKDFIEELGADVVRWLLLSAHYRAPLNVSEATITQAQSEVSKIKQAIKSAKIKLALADSQGLGKLVTDIFDPFMDALKDDLNTQNAMMAIFDGIKMLNQSLRKQPLEVEVISDLTTTIDTMIDIMGLAAIQVNLSEQDKKLYRDWEKAKADKDFDLADQLRQELINKGLLS